MPFHIGNDVYHEIRGPYGMVILRPKHEPDCTFVLLKEVHSSEHWKPCDVPHCANVHSDFIESLHTLAKHHPVEFYVEDFFNGIGEMTASDSEQLARIDRNARKLKQVANTKTKFETNQDLHYGTSHTVEISGLYKNCFLPYTKHKCEYPEIKWNYADARKQQTLSYSSISSYTPLYSEMLKVLDQYRNGSKGLFPDSEKLLNFTDSEPWEFHYEDGITVELLQRIYHNMMELLNASDAPKSMKKLTVHTHILYHFFEVLRNILTMKDSDYVHALLTQPHTVLFDQYRSLPKALRGIFTEASFVEHQAFYTSAQEEDEYVDKLLTLWMEFCEVMVKGDRARQQAIADEMAVMYYPDEEFDYMEKVFMYHTAITLDIYFILRAYNRTKISKVVVGYFGSAHINALVNYFTNIVNTHTVEYSVDGKGVVVITPDVYLVPVKGTRRRKKKGTRKHLPIK